MFIELLRDEHNLHFYKRVIPTGLVLESGMKIRFSRLGISKEQLLAKPSNRIEELEALSRIKAIREKNKELFKDSERNI